MKPNAYPVRVTPTMKLYQIVTADRSAGIITATDPNGTLHTFGPQYPKGFEFNFWGEAGTGRGLVVDEATMSPLRLALWQEMQHGVVKVTPHRSNHMNSDIVRFCVHLATGGVLETVSDYRYHAHWEARARRLLKKYNAVKVDVESPENLIAWGQVRNTNGPVVIYTAQ